MHMRIGSGRPQAAAMLALLPARHRRRATLKVVMHSDVKIIDPNWTTAYIVRNHGYMVYDTLLAMDDKLQRQAADGRSAGRSATTSSPTPSPCATA